jgi:hypothetical protein
MGLVILLGLTLFVFQLFLNLIFFAFFHSILDCFGIKLRDVSQFALYSVISFI